MNEQENISESEGLPSELFDDQQDDDIGYPKGAGVKRQDKKIVFMGKTEMNKTINDVIKNVEAGNGLGSL